MITQLKVKCVSPNAKIPEKATEGSAGLDLFSPHEVLIQPKERVSINSGIQVEFPGNCFGSIHERSSLAKHFGIIAIGGIIDNDFRGTIEIMLWNLSESAFKIEKGMKIAQMICQKYENVEIVQTEKLNETERGGKGFGSSGFF